MTVGDNNLNGSYGLCKGRTYDSLHDNPFRRNLIETTLSKEGYALVPVGAKLKAGDQVCSTENGWATIDPRYDGREVQQNYAICRREQTDQLYFEFIDGLVEDTNGERVTEQERDFRRAAEFFFSDIKWSWKK